MRLLALPIVAMLVAALVVALAATLVSAPFIWAYTRHADRQARRELAFGRALHRAQWRRRLAMGGVN